MSIDIDKIRKSVGFIGESEQIHDMLTTIGQVANTDIIVLINGESGSGKSTIAKLIARLIRPTSGDIFLKGLNKKVSDARKVPLEYRRQVQMVFQDPFGSLNSIHTVFHHLAWPLLRHRLKSQ